MTRQTTMRRGRDIVLATWLCAASGGAWAGWLDDRLIAPFAAAPHVFEAVLSEDGTHLATIVFDPSKGSSVEITDLEKNTSWALPLVRVMPSRKLRYPIAEKAYPVKLAWVDKDLVAVDFSGGTGMVFGLSGGLAGLRYEHFVGMVRIDGEEGLSAVVSGGEGHTLQHASRNAWQLQPLAAGPPGAEPISWRIDATGTMRILRRLEDAEGPAPRISTWYRRDEHAPWKKADERAVTDDEFVPVAVGDAPDRIAVQSRNGGDRLAIWNYDVEHHVFLDSIAAQPDADVVASDTDVVNGSIVRVVSDGLQPHAVWLDVRMARLQAAVDASLPGRANLLQPGTSRRILVHSYSDVDPGQLYVLDTQTLKMQHLAAVRPEIDPSAMQPMQSLHYPSFDGLSIPAYLTLPGKPAKPAPLVVLIHGGPQARDRWGWDPEVQAFAAHGYAVFQPQFRGSSGFGHALEQAGYGQWGLGMQDDITAGVHYLVDQHIADPNRICIVGASYGGYAALWGLAKTPDLYKCGVSTAGVSDIERRLTDDSDSSKDSVARAFMVSRVGDPTLMKATWDSVSPLKHADRIHAPLLLVHGDLDERVPISHSALMLEAMQAQRKDVEWLDFPYEGHNHFAPADEQRYLEAVFKLLARTIGVGDPPGARR